MDEKDIKQRFSEVKKLIDEGRIIEIKDQDLVLAITYLEQLINRYYIEAVKIERELNQLKNEIDYLSKIRDLLSNQLNTIIQETQLQENTEKNETEG